MVLFGTNLIDLGLILFYLIYRKYSTHCIVQDGTSGGVSSSGALILKETLKMLRFSQQKCCNSIFNNHLSGFGCFSLVHFEASKILTNWKIPMIRWPAEQYEVLSGPNWNQPDPAQGRQIEITNTQFQIGTITKMINEHSNIKNTKNTYWYTTHAHIP